MAINVNINNQNKHWILVVLEKIKGIFVIIGDYLVKIIKAIAIFFKSIGRFIKRFWKILIVVLFVTCVGVFGYFCYDYYTYTYIPKKLLDNAVSDIKNKFYSNDDSIKCKYALAIMTDSYEWGYDNVPDKQIREKLLTYIEEVFTYIEFRAYENYPEYQYILGEIYQKGCYAQGYKIDKDAYKAAYWWNEAAKQGYFQAYNKMGIAYMDGIGVEIDKKKALEFIKKGAEAGDYMAQYNYGNLFMSGISIKVGSHKEEYELYDRRKIYGLEFINGELIEKFKGFDDNYKKHYYNKNGRWVYVYEKDVDDYKTILPQDIEQAKYWWRKAAAQGHTEAKDKLQKIY